MNKSIIFYTNINKCTKIDNITNSTCKYHSFS